jgi:hypothetical protein
MSLDIDLYGSSPAAKFILQAPQAGQQQLPGGAEKLENQNENINMQLLV